jgi:hypothetical protein
MPLVILFRTNRCHTRGMVKPSGVVTYPAGFNHTCTLDALDQIEDRHG